MGTLQVVTVVTARATPSSWSIDGTSGSLFWSDICSQRESLLIRMLPLGSPLFLERVTTPITISLSSILSVSSYQVLRSNRNGALSERVEPKASQMWSRFKSQARWTSWFLHTHFDPFALQTLQTISSDYELRKVFHQKGAGNSTKCLVTKFSLLENHQLAGEYINI